MNETAQEVGFFNFNHIIMDHILVPIGICVVLPVLIVWLVSRTRQNEINRKTEIVLKAIEAGATIDTNLFKNQQDNKTIKERLLKRLTGGCIFTLMGIAFLCIGLYNGATCTEAMSKDSIVMPLLFSGIWFAIGISLLVVFFVGKSLLAKEIEAEEKSLLQK